MNNYKNNHRRSRFKSNIDRGYRKRNGNGHKIHSDFSNNLDFKRKFPGRNNQNASKLVDKYNDLAREALSNGDKILSENYMQHADHFVRIINSREVIKEELGKSNKLSEPNKEKDEKVLSDEKKSSELNVND